ncbi:hypothetical protein Tco_1225111 [Tanacetum coccineum]
MGRDTIQLEDAVSTISEEYLLEFTSEYGIPESLHPELPGPEEPIVEFFLGKREFIPRSQLLWKTGDEILNEDSDTDEDEVFLPNDGNSFPSSSGGGGQTLEEDMLNAYDDYEDQFEEYPSLYQEFCDQFDFKVVMGDFTLIHCTSMLFWCNAFYRGIDSILPKKKAGDRNSKYVHNVVKGRRNRNIISYVEDLEGNPFHGNSVGEQFVSHFKNVLGKSSKVLPINDPSGLFHKKLSEADALYMVRNISDDEIKKALFDIDGNKAPSPDGFSS